MSDSVLVLVISSSLSAELSRDFPASFIVEPGTALPHYLVKMKIQIHTDSTQATAYTSICSQPHKHYPVPLCAMSFVLLLLFSYFYGATIRRNNQNQSNYFAMHSYIHDVQPYLYLQLYVYLYLYLHCAWRRRRRRHRVRLLQFPFLILRFFTLKKDLRMRIRAVLFSITFLRNLSRVGVSGHAYPRRADHLIYVCSFRWCTFLRKFCFALWHKYILCLGLLYLAYFCLFKKEILLFDKMY